jgi:hypothetical protein
MPHEFPFKVVNVSADLSALCFKSRDNVSFAHAAEVVGRRSKFLWRLRHNTDDIE